MTLANRMSWHHALPDDVPKSCCHSQLSPSWHSIAPFYFPLIVAVSLSFCIALSLFNANVRGSNKIANLPQSSLNGTMSQCSMFRMAKRLIELPPVFLAANAYAWMAYTHIHTVLLLTHTHTHIITFGVGAWLLWLLEKSFIENDTRRQMASLSLSMYMCVCVRPADIVVVC